MHRQPGSAQTHPARTRHDAGMPNYTYRASWDVLQGDYFAQCLEFPLDTARGATAHEAIAALEQTVEVLLAEREQYGLKPPESLTDHRYSGTFVVRTSAMLHRRLTVEAAEQGVSMNQWIVAKLSDRPIRSALDELFND